MSSTEIQQLPVLAMVGRQPVECRLLQSLSDLPLEAIWGHSLFDNADRCALMATCRTARDVFGRLTQRLAKLQLRLLMRPGVHGPWSAWRSAAEDSAEPGLRVLSWFPAARIELLQLSLFCGGLYIGDSFRSFFVGAGGRLSDLTSLTLSKPVSELESIPWQGSHM